MENLLSPKPLSTGQVLESVSYGKISGQPSRILQSDGFKEALAEAGLKEALIAQGINPSKIANRINVLLHGVDKEGRDDYNAIDKGLKHATAIYGIMQEQTKTQNVYNFFHTPEFQAKISQYDQNIKNHILDVQTNQTNEETMDSSE